MHYTLCTFKLILDAIITSRQFYFSAFFRCLLSYSLNFRTEDFFLNPDDRLFLFCGPCLGDILHQTIFAFLTILEPWLAIKLIKSKL